LLLQFTASLVAEGTYLFNTLHWPWYTARIWSSQWGCYDSWLILEMWLLNVFENVYDCCCSNHVLVSVLWVGSHCCWYVGRAEILTILLSDHLAIWFSLTWIVSREKFSVLMKMCFCWWSLQETVAIVHAMILVFWFGVTVLFSSSCSLLLQSLFVCSWITLSLVSDCLAIFVNIESS
jgi:hypothetical protein